VFQGHTIFNVTPNGAVSHRKEKYRIWVSIINNNVSPARAGKRANPSSVKLLFFIHNGNTRILSKNRWTGIIHVLTTGTRARGPKKNWMEGIRKATNERSRNESQWEDRKQWSLGVERF